MSRIGDTLKRFARPTLRRIVTYLRSKPLYKGQAAWILGHMPALDARLRSFARNVPVAGLESLGIAPPASPQTVNWPSETGPAMPRAIGDRILYFYADHTAQCPVNTGMQRVTRRLGRALLEAGEQVRFVKWLPAEKRFVLLNRAELNHLAQWSGPALSPAELELYPAPGQPSVGIARHGLDEGHWLIVPEVTHITYHPEPVTLDVLTGARGSGLKTAVVFYDAIPLRRPELAAAVTPHADYMHHLLLADLIVPISHWSGRDLAAFFQVHDGAAPERLPRIASTPLPGESQLAPRVTVPPLAADAKRLVLSVGSIEVRKNQAALVAAFERFCDAHPDTDWQLALVGNLHPDVAPVIDRAVQRNPRIKYLHHLPDAELDALYRACAFTVFPSVEEGFGLPILESLWYGKPCVCADFGAMGEVAAGGGCRMIDTRRPEALYDAVSGLMTRPEAIDALAREAVARPIESWADYAGHFVRLIDEESNPLRRIGTVYYWVDHTAGYPGNTGIQRVVRGLARALTGIGIPLVPVTWNEAERRLEPADAAALEHLSLWNGPAPSAWADWRDPRDGVSPRDWLLIPELTTYLPATRLADIKACTDGLGLRCAWVFYDAIPWNLRAMYPPEASSAHRTYMEGLNAFPKVLCISRHSRDSLITFLAGTALRTPALDSRIEAVPLPEEFLEAPRVTAPKEPFDGPVVRILAVGTVEPRKNHLVLLDAYRRMAARTSRTVELVIAGGKPYPELARQVQEAIAELPGVTWTLGADDAGLRALYAASDFTVYPSIEEGFGLPIAESLWNARPCVCRDAGSMKEVAEGGGCLMVDTTDPEALADAMLRLVEDVELRRALAGEAVSRPFRTWADYGRDVALRLATERNVPLPIVPAATLAAAAAPDEATFYKEFVTLSPRPLLSVCITTYNRAEWLAVNLANIMRLMPEPRDDVEIFVCDNASTDHTPEVVRPYLERPGFRYRRNPVNVGMLGNLKVTASHARGRYVWILGDDDLLKPGGIERVLDAIRTNPSIALVYLNYAYTKEEDPKAVKDLDAFLSGAPPIVVPEPDLVAPIHRICTRSENVFTAIYCLVFRRDHALRAYAQNVEGRPFTTLLTCIPTTHYVLNRMMEEQACWIGEPQLVVNMNVSWIRYAPLWVLERIPEVWDLAERLGADPDEVDRWRSHHLPGVVHYFRVIMEEGTELCADDFSAARLISRIKHLPAYAEYAASLRDSYEKGHGRGSPIAAAPPEWVFHWTPAAPDAGGEEHPESLVSEAAR